MDINPRWDLPRGPDAAAFGLVFLHSKATLSSTSRLAPAARRPLRLNPLCNGCHRHRRVDHGRARGRTERVVRGAFHSGASRCAANRVRRQFQVGTPHIFCWGFTGTPVNISDLSGVCWLIRGAQNNSFKYCCFLFNSVYLQLIASV